MTSGDGGIGQGCPNESRAALVERAMGQFGAAVYRFALHQLRSPGAAEEVAQDVFVALFATRADIKDDCHLRRWLMRATADRCKNRWRARARRREEAVDPRGLEERLGDAAPTEASAAAERDGDAVLWEHVDALPVPLREAIYLFYVEEYPTEEIAAIVGVTPATVRTRLHRARARLRKMLEGGA